MGGKVERNRVGWKTKSVDKILVERIRVPRRVMVAKKE